MKLFDRINVFQIFSKHFATLYDYGQLSFKGKRKVPFGDIFTFIIFPIIVALVLVVAMQLYIDTTYLNVIITSLSIFVGLLFSLLTLVFDLARKAKNENHNTNKEKAKFRLLTELFANIAFAIAISIISIICTLMTRFRPEPIIDYLKQFECFVWIKYAYLTLTNVVALYFVLLFLMTLLMILKRFFLIFVTEIEKE